MHPRPISLIITTLAGIALAFLLVALDAGLGGVAWLAVGFVAALATQHAQTYWFSSTIERSEGGEWVDRLPLGLGSLRAPLRRLRDQIEATTGEVAAVVARERLRVVEIEALESELETTKRELHLARRRAALPTVIGDGASGSDITPEMLADIALSVSEQATSVALGDVLALAVAESGWEPGSLVVRGTIPVVHGPGRLIATVVVDVLDGMPRIGPTTVWSRVDGGLVLLRFEGLGLDGIASDPRFDLARRLLGPLGGALLDAPGPDRGLVVSIPLRMSSYDAA